MELYDKKLLIYENGMISYGQPGYLESNLVKEYINIFSVENNGGT